jgi:hypothetical protein
VSVFCHLQNLWTVHDCRQVVPSTLESEVR